MMEKQIAIIGFTQNHQSYYASCTSLFLQRGFNVIVLTYPEIQEEIHALAVTDQRRLTFCLRRASSPAETTYSFLQRSSDAIKQHLESQNKIKKPLYCLPFAIPGDEKRQHHKNKPLIITIPGMVDTSRKDYDTALNAFAKILRERPGRIQLRLLGYSVPGAESARIIARCQQINRDCGENAVHYWTEYISEDIFRRELETTDVLLANAHQYFRQGKGRAETYGLTKVSGVACLALGCKCPLLKPHYYPVLSDMEGQMIDYIGEDGLQQRLLDMIDGELDLNELIKKAEMSAVRYRSYINTEIDRLMSNELAT